MGQASTVKYLGDLSTEMVHIESGERIHTDAPKDNAGKGEGFSPTDLVATSLASCMITTMGIKARQHEIDLVGTHADVVKEMSANPRRISAIRINIYFPHPPALYFPRLFFRLQIHTISEAFFFRSPPQARNFLRYTFDNRGIPFVVRRRHFLRP